MQGLLQDQNEVRPILSSVFCLCQGLSVLSFKWNSNSAKKGFALENITKHNSVVVSRLKVIFWITALNPHRVGRSLRSISLKVAHAGEA